MDLRQFSATFEAIEREVGRVFVGQDEVLTAVLVAMLARGHVLLEGVPGVGKTLLVRTLGEVLGCHFRRVQFTPDLMPSDVTGSSLYNSQKGAFEFKHGPVFTHILLADEVNRAPAKTQSAMLEAMAERSVTVDGVTHPLPDPYFVLATQNPLESAGTYALPEAQLDRFLFKVLIDHPPQHVEEELLRNVRDGFDAANLASANLQRITTAEGVRAMQGAVQSVRVDEKIISYIATLVANTRRHRAVQIGASPRAAIALLQTGRVEAAVQGRDFVVPDDIKTHGKAVLRHRLILQPDAEIEGVTPDEVVEGVLHETQVPGMGDARGSARPAPASPAAAPSYAPSAPRSGAFSGGQAAQSAPTAPAVAAAAPARPSAAQSASADLWTDPAPAPSAPARSAGAPSGTGPARPAGPDPDTLPPPGVGPYGGGGGRQGS